MPRVPSNQLRVESGPSGIKHQQHKYRCYTVGIKDPSG